jgi:hypothetical protein
MATTAFSAWHPRADFFDFNLKFLFYVGLWPDNDWDERKRWIYKIYTCTLFLLSFIYITITGIGAYLTKEDLIVFLTNMDKTIVTYNYILKIIIFCIRRNHINDLVTEILHSGDIIDEDRKNLMKHHVIVVIGVIMTITGGFQLTAQMDGEILLDAWLPFDPKKNDFTLFLASQILGGLFVIPCLCRAISIQGIVCSITMYLCDQLVDLQMRLKALDYEDNETIKRNEFKEIIKKHIRLIG